MKEEMYERIDAYLRGEMMGEELIEFEAMLESDADLRSEVDTTRHIKTAFEKEGEKEALKDLESMTKEDMERLLFADKKKTISLQAVYRRLSYFTTIAAILVLIFLFIKPDNSGEKLFAAYYDREALEILPSRGELTEMEAKSDSLYIFALNKIDRNEAEASVSILKDLSSNTEFEYQAEAEWLLALVYIKTNKKELALEVLDRMIAENGFYANRAVSLKNDLIR
ncbi:hypothetical protein LJC06_00670 [Bacteroidales bacterium OttesenSCG-928-I14]|nr:hypothetical protein [Bacteroidales bacterium OttesenSCG-928-I14]